MLIVFRVASVAGAAEKGPLALYSTRAASRGGNLWQHVLFVLACDTARCTEQETLNRHLKVTYHENLTFPGFKCYNQVPDASTNQGNVKKINPVTLF